MAGKFSFIAISHITSGYVEFIYLISECSLTRSIEIIANKRILELGCGTGFLGVIIASLQQLSTTQPCPLWLSDIREEVLTRCRDNIQLPCSMFFSCWN